ncbi:SWIB/MDM2 domain protein [Aspergillus vadensis CBS 113365]|uniref:SWIB-domain-containing protein n=1 Tax=Aspergillus vadensis (strain CBS 113365 / IMI 142717 / IBT 24658) TaxID=1448311 RepID=A0A319B0Z9_ASPVC|nr:SWIB-domain-containing protein [Aspergillus vadensis CBS 113365]PYH65411.1 SWIB-domain-containing protein [Aspergillus vadensis CBS 113365]
MAFSVSHAIVSPEARDQYIPIIDSILAKSDLTTISSKTIRNGLQDEIGYDLTPHKLAIKQLIMERFDVCAAQKGIQTASETPATSASTNGHGKDHDSVTPVEPSSPAQSSMSQKRQAESEECSDTSSKTPPIKKKKPDNDIDADALFAAKLQAEENMRARQTRGASTRRSQPVKKKQPTKAKTSKKVKAEDDSELESGSDSGKKVNRSGGFHKPLTLSPALSALLDGEVTLSRPQTVKRLWQYIHEHDLQDPNDRRQIRCDDAMRAVFKQDRIHMFTMTKILSQNLYSPDE